MLNKDNITLNLKEEVSKEWAEFLEPLFEMWFEQSKKAETEYEQSQAGKAEGEKTA